MVHPQSPSDSRCLVVAHRGASAQWPENTLEAFEAAIEEGADVVELDVRLSLDGVPVVMHDADVARSTGGRGLVHELTLPELKALDAAPGRTGRAEVPTLGEVLELTSGRVGIDLEIKNIPGDPAFDSPREGILHAALAELERSSYSGEAMISSFNTMTIERSRELAPDVPTGVLTIEAVDAPSALAYAQRADHDWVLPQWGAVTRAGSEFLAQAHDAGIRVGTWVVDHEADLRTLFEWEADAVATNDPRLAVAVRDQEGRGA